MIEHEWTFLCRDLVANETGVFSILDCFCVQLHEHFPSSTGPFIIASGFSGDKGDSFEYKISVLDPDLSGILETEPRILTCAADRSTGHKLVHRQPFNGLELKSPATLMFNIHVNDKVIHQAPLFITTI